MSTCHALRDECARRLIGEGVELRHERDVISFVQFTSSNSNLYFAFLRELRITASLDGSSPPDSDASGWKKALLRLLAHPMLSLEVLHLNAPEPLLKSEQIRAAIERLSTIKELSLEEPRKHTWQMMQHLASPLVTVTINVVSKERYTLTSALAVNPVTRLARFSETLETVYWNQEDQYQNPLNISIPVNSVIQRYPRMRDFRMYYYNNCPGAAYMAFPAAVPDVRPFLVAFPNLQVFQLSHFPPTHKGFDTDNPPSLQRRDLNRLAHAALEGGRGPWPELVQCSGDLRSLFYLAHDGPVHTLQVRSCPATAWYLDKLRTIVEDTRPTVLEVQVLEWDVTTAPPEYSIIEALCTLPVRTVQSLQMELVLPRILVREPQAINREQITDALVVAFKNLAPEIKNIQLYLDFQIITLLGGTLQDQPSWDTLDIRSQARRFNPNVGSTPVP
ncbi:hypothetical protein K466DRAFT_603280 [Polyporus arcularius HHB13444]|uniref:F-box domain-containing protein n=1 Tax=Polyporus arcularius HHB13444 TaxID=1314778 RepID=A0A5C3P0V7_9APHY|nr:hypothetical protein K466DRAFT_603280 [Polyporus arcularius HHB13444]